MKHPIIACLAAVAMLTACKTTADKATPAADDLWANRDTTVSPGDDFFMYANGGWIKNNPIPASESGWGIGHLVNEELYKRKLAINEKAVQENAASGTVSRKIADFWKAAMDTVRINQVGVAALKANLDRTFRLDPRVLLGTLGALVVYLGGWTVLFLRAFRTPAGAA